MYLTCEDIELFSNTNIAFVVSNRHGGISGGPYLSMNLAYHVGDKDSNVKANRDILLQHPLLLSTRLVYVNQIHSNNIVSIRGRYARTYSYVNGDSLLFREDLLLDNASELLLNSADGTITADSNLACMIMVADCNPILLYSQQHNVFAILHAGRAGLCKDIITNCINILYLEYGIKAKDIMAFVGPSIRKCCYEVGDDLAQDLSKSFSMSCIESRYSGNRSRYYLDMIYIISLQFSKCGIDCVEIIDICTCCNEDYFSYRRDNCTGRFVLIARLKG